jgi:hypothetical protein
LLFWFFGGIGVIGGLLSLQRWIAA